MLTYLYLVTFIAIIILFILFIYLMRFFKNRIITNIIFISITFICYVFVVLISYLQNGLYDWNFHNTLPTANVSPFMFCICPIYLLLPQKVRKYFGNLISLLCAGMLLSPLISCVHFFIINYKFHSQFLLDYAAHLSLSLFGIYLVQSKQVEMKNKDSVIGGSIIISVAITMLIINLIFDTSFFGLSLCGKHNIYNQVIVDNSYLSALIYFIGLSSVLFLGFFFNKLIILINNKTK